MERINAAIYPDEEAGEQPFEDGMIIQKDALNLKLGKRIRVAKDYGVCLFSMSLIGTLYFIIRLIISMAQGDPSE